MLRTIAVLAASLLIASRALAHGDESHDQHGTDHSAAGRAADPATAQRTVVVEMRDSYQFSPSEIEVKTGEVVRFVVVNAGRQTHEMVLGTLKELEAHNEMMRKNPKGMHHGEPGMAHVA